MYPILIAGVRGASFFVFVISLSFVSTIIRCCQTAVMSYHE